MVETCYILVVLVFPLVTAVVMTFIPVIWTHLNGDMSNVMGMYHRKNMVMYVQCIAFFSINSLVLKIYIYFISADREKASNRDMIKFQSFFPQLTSYFAFQIITFKNLNHSL